MKKFINEIVIPNTKEFSNHINKRRFKLIVFGSLLVVLLLLTVFLTPTTLSRYSTSTDSSAETQIAFYLLKPTYQTNTVLLDEITPRNAPYTYSFSISNTNGTKRTETNLQYDLSIKTTTNLPLTYELYMNSVYTDANADEVITDSDTVQDDDGTYFNIFTTDTEYFNYSYNQTNNYQLVIYFPSNCVDEMYQDIVELIEIRIESKQVMT